MLTIALLCLTGVALHLHHCGESGVTVASIYVPAGCDNNTHAQSCCAHEDEAAGLEYTNQCCTTGTFLLTLINDYQPRYSPLSAPAVLQFLALNPALARGAGMQTVPTHLRPTPPLGLLGVRTTVIRC